MPDVDRLAAYLNDHRAGATAAVHLIDRMTTSEDDATPREFLRDLHDRVDADLDTLEDVMRRLDIEHDPVRAAGGWLGEKLTRVRLSDVVTGSIHLSHLLELETIALGIHGKRGMWEVLARVAGDDPRLEGIDFDELVERANRQQEDVQQHRRAMADAAFA